MANDPNLSYPPRPEDGAGPLPDDPAQQSLVSALRGSFNILRLLMVVLVGLYLFSGVFRVESGEQGVVSRFGKLRQIEVDGRRTPVFPEGWHWSLPDPFDTKYILTGRIQELKVTTFMFQHGEAATSRDLAAIVPRSADLKPGLDGAMLTGDKNLSHGRWEVQYRIENAADFVRNVGGDVDEFRPLLGRLTETAVIREVAGRTVEEVTREALDRVRRGVQRRLQASLDELHTGVTVVEVVAYTIEPGRVRQAFLDVIRAENERQRLEYEANERATEILSRAAGPYYPELVKLIRAYGDAQLAGAEQAALDELVFAINDALMETREMGGGQVAVRISQAEAEAAAISEGLQREYEEFQKYLEQRAARPRITLLGLWNNMREQILSNRLNEVFFVPEGDEIEILVNRDPQRLIELEQERQLRRQRGEQ